MARIAVRVVVAVLAAGLLALAAPAGAQQGPGSTTVPSIELDGEITPATASWIESALDAAADDGAPLAIIRLDTPGGLDESMREIVKDILAAPMPVVVYVYPNGARAGSAGVFITQAGDVAAMAPETNIGSASPITSTGDDIGGTLGRKITNDASAYVRALATAHGRNPDLAEQMVREATNVAAAEALDAGLIDLIAGDQEELLADLDGFEIRGPKQATLDTAGYSISARDMPLRYELMQILVNPNVAYLLLLVGLLGLLLEAFAPGTIIPGTIGAVCLVLGLIGAVQLPVAAVGVVLLVAGAALIVAEVNLPTAGILGVLGVAALVGGGLLIFDTRTDEIDVSPAFVIAVGSVLGLATVFVGAKGLQARKRPVRTGVEELIGSLATVRSPLDPAGQVFVEGALWEARVDPASDPVEAGYRVRVEGIDGLELVVSPLEDGPLAPGGETVGSEPEGAS